MTKVRPTLRCLVEDLDEPIPPVTVALDELVHPLVRKANDQHAEPERSCERIRAIDDTVVFKVKIQRWRGATWQEMGSQDRWWLIAGGRREQGSKDDFYSAFASRARAARKAQNANAPARIATDTCTVDWLPNEQDHQRYRLEAALRLRRELAAAITDLVRASLLDGYEHQRTVNGATLGVLVRAEDGHETYVAVRVTGPVPQGFVAVVLDLVPGCDRKSWMPELAMPTRHLEPNEQVWSTLMHPGAAAELLADDTA